MFAHFCSDLSGHLVKDCPVIPPGYICKQCNTPGHFLRDCPLISLPPKCHICAKSGHRARECPERRDRPPLRNKKRNNAGQGRNDGSKKKRQEINRKYQSRNCLLIVSGELLLLFIKRIKRQTFDCRCWRELLRRPCKR